MNHIQYFSLIFLILKGNDFICIGLIFTKKYNKLWKIFDIGLVGVSQNFHTYFSMSRLKKFGQHWSRKNELKQARKSINCSASREATF
jgi:hypothetical protein